MDVFENGEATLGGAPLNVIFHFHHLSTATALWQGEAVILSAVGSDPSGRYIRSAVATAGISTDYLAEVERPTGSALVFESEGGAGFEILPDVAWDYIRLSDGASDLALQCDAVVFGSLAQRSEVSRESIRHFVSQVNGHRLFDVNLRRNTTSGVAGYSAEIIAKSLELATLAKMNDWELEEVCSLLGFNSESLDSGDRTRLLMERLREEFSLDAVAVTRGSKGALLASRGKYLKLPDSGLDQSLVHPVGAGDSFVAGLLFGIMQEWALEYCLELANILSSWVVRNVSATPPLPESVLSKIRGLHLKASMMTLL